MSKQQFISRELKSLRQAEAFQNRLYEKYDSVKIIESPRFSEQGVYTWLIQERPDDLKDRYLNALAEAIATRGPRKGMLKAKCPAVDTDAAAVWLGIMSKANPFKVGMAHMMFMRPERKRLYEYAYLRASDMGRNIINLDSDRRALEALGVWY